MKRTNRGINKLLAIKFLTTMGAIDQNTASHLDPRFAVKAPKPKAPKGYKPRIGDRVQGLDYLGQPVTGIVREVNFNSKEVMLWTDQSLETAAYSVDLTLIQK